MLLAIATPTTSDDLLRHIAEAVGKAKTEDGHDRDFTAKRLEMSPGWFDVLIKEAVIGDVDEAVVEYMNGRKVILARNANLKDNQFIFEIE